MNIKSNNTIDHISSFLTELTNIRTKYNHRYNIINNQSNTNININQYLSTKPLTGLKSHFKLCPICDNKFHITNFKNHTISCKAICNICNKNCTTKAKLNLHLNKHKNTKHKYFCKNKGCIAKYITLQAFLKHQKLCKLEVCDICLKTGMNPPYKIARKILMTIHKRDFHHVIYPPLKCKHCNKPFKNSYQLSKHLKETHRDSLKEFTCNNCNRKFIQKNNYTKHKNKCLVHLIN